MKSIIVKKKIQYNYVIKKKHLILQRPGTGIEPKFLNKILNRKVKRSLNEGELIKWSDLKN